LMASGSEVSLVLEVQEELAATGIRSRVVSFPSLELFNQQDQAYQDRVLPPDITKRLAVEAGVTMPWHQYIGKDGAIIGIDTFGESGEGKAVMEHFGFSVTNVYEKAKQLLKT